MQHATLEYRRQLPGRSALGGVQHAASLGVHPLCAVDHNKRVSRHLVERIGMEGVAELQAFHLAVQSDLLRRVGSQG